jgi:hypothetical protein
MKSIDFKNKRILSPYNNLANTSLTQQFNKTVLSAGAVAKRKEGKPLEKLLLKSLDSTI